MTERELILSAITDRGGEAPVTRPEFTKVGGEDLWGRFEKEITVLGGRLIDAAELQNYKNKSIWVDPALESQLQAKSTASTIWDSEVGFSKAEFAIAQTGTLVLCAGAGSFRLSSLVPPINIVLVRKNDIVPSLVEAMEKLPKQTAFFVTGPSRTTDIEGVLVRGVHGPRELLVCIV